MLRQEKGITLIALVITIIVLLILAGVTIAMLTGENGLLTRSTESSMETALSKAKDNITLHVQDVMAQYYQDKYSNNKTDAELKASYGATNGTAPSLTDVVKKALEECTDGFSGTSVTGHTVPTIKEGTIISFTESSGTFTLTYLAGNNTRSYTATPQSNGTVTFTIANNNE